MRNSVIVVIGITFILILETLSRWQDNNLWTNYSHLRLRLLDFRAEFIHSHG